MSDEVQFEIGQPVQLEQIPSYKTGSKYDELFKAVDQLAPGQWLPVTVERERQGQRLVEVAKMRGYRRKRRGLVVYIANKAEFSTEPTVGDFTGTYECDGTNCPPRPHDHRPNKEMHEDQ